MNPGDTLSGIADARHLAGGWQQLYQANQAVIGADPDLIEPGQVLRLG
ncbi:LysM peptidoglycan-binding domain-containing protein [Kitasatospora sp. NBC_00374]